MKLESEMFIGSITKMNEKELEEALREANRELATKRFNKIKVSISPDKINKELLKKLKKCNVSTIELEAQTTNDYILKRCGYTYSIEDIKKAAKKIKWSRYRISFSSWDRTSR